MDLCRLGVGKQEAREFDWIMSNLKRTEGTPQNAGWKAKLENWKKCHRRSAAFLEQAHKLGREIGGPLKFWITPVELRR